MPDPQAPAVVFDTDVASRLFRGRGQLSAAATERGRPRPVNDTWIAACCIAYGLPLATLNIKDFADFAEHEGLSLIRP